MSGDTALFHAICNGNGTYYTQAAETPKGPPCRWQWCPTIKAYVLANRRNGKAGTRILPHDLLYRCCVCGVIHG